MKSSNEEKFTIKVYMTKTPNEWLKMDMSLIGLIFGFTKKTMDAIYSINDSKLSKFIVFSRKGLMNGTGICMSQGERLSKNEKARLGDLIGFRKEPFLKGHKWHTPFTKKSINEIDFMLKTLKLKLRFD